MSVTVPPCTAPACEAVTSTAIGDPARTMEPVTTAEEALDAPRRAAPVRSAARAGALHQVRAWGQLVIGSATIGLGVALLVRAQLGLDGYSCLCAAIAAQLHVAIGTASVLLAAVLLVIASAGSRRLPHPGAALQFLVVGQGINESLAVVPDPHGLLLRAAVGLLGVTVIGAGVGAYLGAELCLAPFEAVVTLCAAVVRRRFALVYNVLEALCLVTGFALGGSVGVMTAAVALACGPIAAAARRRCTVRPLSATPAPAAP